jgi:hypothetical protein
MFGCSTNTEIENTSSDMNHDSVSLNEAIKVSSNKFVLKSADQEAVMEWPEIKGDLKGETLKKMNSIISIDSVCGKSIEEIQLNYKNCSCGTVGSGFSVNYNKNNILSLSISVETMGAYPDGYLRSFNFNTKTGDILTIDSLIKNDSLASLISILNHELGRRIEEAKAMADEDAEKSGDSEFIDNLFDKTEFTQEDLKNFTVTDKGINFYFEFGFPHVAQALEPAGDFFITKEELTKYLKDGIKI